MKFCIQRFLCMFESSYLNITSHLSAQYKKFHSNLGKAQDRINHQCEINAHLTDSQSVKPLLTDSELRLWHSVMSHDPLSLSG